MLTKNGDILVILNLSVRNFMRNIRYYLDDCLTRGVEILIGLTNIFCLYRCPGACNEPHNSPRRSVLKSGGACWSFADVTSESFSPLSICSDIHYLSVDSLIAIRSHQICHTPRRRGKPPCWSFMTP